MHIEPDIGLRGRTDDMKMTRHWTKQTMPATRRRTRPKKRVSRVLCAIVAAVSALVLVPSGADAAEGSTLDLRVLIVAVGDPGVDPGLDLMDDLLDELGVPYDVLDSSTTDLTESTLRSGSHGFYNGVIVTVADTYLPVAGGAGFSFDEWNVLHQYERDFGVREAVLAGWPTTGGTPNYGMADVQYAGGATAQWTGAADAGVFSYVNASSSPSITDFAFSATARGAAGDPVVTPYLADSADPSRTLVSHLQYDDGREVLLSTVTNAWFLPYSQIMAYGFLDFATSGLHLGAMQMHLAAHIDDLFLSADRWDPATNQTLYDNPYRNTAADIATTVSAQNQFNSTFGSVDQFKVDFAFNGQGASTETQSVPVPTSGDTFIDEPNPTSNYSTQGRLRVRHNLSRPRDRQALMAFALPSEAANAPTASLVVRSSVQNSGTATVEVCPLTEPWVAAEATWSQASAGVAWSTGGGAAYDATACITTDISTGTYAIDITPIVTLWNSGVANHGLVVRTDGTLNVNLWSVESNTDPRIDLTTTSTGDPLVDAVKAQAGNFRFLNHTYTHRDMDVSAGTTAADAQSEIELNRQVWQALGLPEAAENNPVVVTGNHSGLEDDNGTELDPSDDITYPTGLNTAMVSGFESVGIQYMASDTSRVNTGVEQYVPGSGIALLPRYPTSVFYNTITPEELVDEYNYIFHERYLEAGQDPCTIPGALCSPRTYQEILDAEATTALRHLLSGKRFPHYFHIANIVDYDGQGSTLLFDWLEAVVSAYEAQLDLPIVNLPYHEIAERTSDALALDGATVSAQLDLATDQVTLSADSAVDLTVTGLAGGSAYGNRQLRDLTIGTTPVTVPIAG
jgi:hypothetical protein